MKRGTKWLGLALFLLILSKAIRTQTDGVNLAKTARCMEGREEWASKEIEVREGRYTYLGSGVQCYAFLSEDGTTVLKLFKHYHLFPPTPFLRKLPFASSAVKKRDRRMESLFKSAIFAAEHLKEETAVIGVQINPSNRKLPLIELEDKIGVVHKVDLSHTPFLLQKKATPFFETLETFSPSEIALAIEELIALFKRFDSSDHLLSTNFGFCEKKPCAIDIGSLKKRREPLTRKELYFLTLQLREWLKLHHPEHISKLDEAIG